MTETQKVVIGQFRSYSACATFGYIVGIYFDGYIL